MEHKLPLTPGSYYHIYNRGLNKSRIFFREDDFVHFIDLMRIYLAPISDVYCYAIMSNHFHIAMRVKTDSEIAWLIPENASEKDLSRKWATTFNIAENTQLRKKPDAPNMLRHMLSAYTKWFNERNQRSGKLFEERPERKIVNSEDQMRQLIIYVNRNPEMHKVTNAYHEYPWTSYHALMSDSSTWLSRSKVMELFRDKETFSAAMNKVDFDEWLKALE